VWHSAGVQLIGLYEGERAPVGHRPVDGPLLDAWFELNYRLQEEAVDAQVNKSFIEQWLMRLWTIVSPRPECFWRHNYFWRLSNGSDQDGLWVVH
jgi:hypothetical protein